MTDDEKDALVATASSWDDLLRILEEISPITYSNGASYSAVSVREFAQRFCGQHNALTRNHGIRWKALEVLNIRCKLGCCEDRPVVYQF